MQRCFICGNTHCPPSHVPIQCCANEEGEFDEFKTRHDVDGTCYQALHFGCARWEPAPYRRVYFYPGMPDVEDPVPWTTRYKQLVHYKNEKGDCKVPTMQDGLLGKWVARQRKLKKLKDEGKDSDITKTQIKKLDTIGIDWTGEMHTDPVDEIYCDLHAKEIYKNRPQRNQPTQQTAQRTRAVCRLGATSGAATAAGPPSQQQSAPSGNRAQAGRPTPQVPRPLASSSTQQPGAPPARISASSSQQPEPPRRDWFKDIRDDVVIKIRRAHERKQSIPEATNSVREHWKNQKLMTKREFKSLWNRVKAAIQAMPNEELCPPSNGEPENNAEEEKDNDTNRWSSIWEPGGRFEFGDWDTVVEIPSS